MVTDYRIAYLNALQSMSETAFDAHLTQTIERKKSEMFWAEFRKGLAAAIAVPLTFVSLLFR